MTKKDLAGIEMKNKPNSEELQGHFQSELIRALVQIFGVNDSGELKNKMKNGTDKEQAILQTAIKPTRPIKSVEILSKGQKVSVDDGDDKIEKDLPEGTLRIEYGKGEKDVADLVVYVYKIGDNIQMNVSAKEVDYEEQFLLSKAGLSKRSNAVIFPHDKRGHSRQLPKKSPGGSNPNN